MKRFKPLIYVLMILALVCVGVFGALNVSAIDAPTSLSAVASGVQGYTNLLETGDMSILVYYNIYYAGTLPVEPANQSFIVRVMKGGTTIKSLQPYAYNDLGYNRGVVGFYFSAAEVTASALTTSNVSIQIVGNPLMTWTPTVVPSAGMGIDQWHTTAATSKQEMSTKIIDWAFQLQQYWQLQLVGNSGLEMYLDDAGVNYFAFAVENVMQICPEIFKYRTRPPEYKTWTATATMFPTIAPSLEPTESAGIFGVTTGALSTGMVGIGIVVFLVVIMMRQPRLGRYAFLLAGVLVIFYTRMNQMVGVWITVVGVIALLVIGYLIFYEKSGA